MSEDLALLVVRLFGGFWKLRCRMQSAGRGSLASATLRLIYYTYLQRYGAFVGHSARFASEPCFPHNLNGIFVAGNAQIGRNCVLFHHVTIGANPIPGSRGVGSPTLGDNVYVGAGAKIIGNVRIGDNSRIGANCVVTRNVAPNSVVLLPQPQIIVHGETLDNRYYRWSPEGPVYFASGNWILEKDPNVVESLREAL